MRFVGEEGVRVRDLEELARTPTNLKGMDRWGYIVVEKPSRSGSVIHATPTSRMAQDVWRLLFAVIENRWEERFGKDAVSPLRATLLAVIGQIDLELPNCLPVLGYGLFSKGPDRKSKRSTSRSPSVPI